MLSNSFQLFRIFGFPIKVHFSWFIIAILVVWSLAVHVFPTYVDGLSSQTIWTMSVLGALGLFASIVLHELGHALAARHYNIKMRGITLFVFGGVAEMTEEPDSPKAEFVVAVAGPIVSVGIALLCIVSAALVPDGGSMQEVTRQGLSYEVLQAEQPVWAAANTTLSWLGWINSIIVIFNSVPAFPLDGGRVLRSILWKLKGSLKWATQVTSRIGTGFSFFLMAMAVVFLFMGNLFGAIWWFVLALFLQGAAKSSYQQLLLRRSLEGEKVEAFMTRDLVSAPPSISLQDFVDDYVYKHHYKFYPVSSHRELAGCISTRQIKDVPREKWSNTRVSDVAEACGEKNTIAPDADAMKALERMNRNQASRLLVTNKDNELLGIITLKDLMNFLALKVQFEEDEELEMAENLS